MNKYYYDLHVHSCLSPCGDDDNTPNNIAGMATLCGLNIVALTDHNSCKNCPAFFSAAEKYGIIPIAGMELTTSEDIHVVCLFETLADAMRFDDLIEERIAKVRNRPKIFGRQIVTDGEDNPVCEVDNLLIYATDVSIEDVSELVAPYGGVCFPAHIDREANGIISVLGTLPTNSDFTFYELHDSESLDEYSTKYNIPKDRFIISSDAHYLPDMRDKEAFFLLNPEADDSDSVRHSLFKVLRGE